MTPEHDQGRYELKFVCERLALPGVLDRIAVDGEGFQDRHPPRIVQSIYLDTHGERDVQDNLAGISARQKLRFRWYGDETRSAAGQLERKIRRSQFGWKKRVEIPEPVRLEGVRRSAFMNSLRAQVSGDWRVDLDAAVSPSQWIRYRRRYLVSFDRRVRVTIDTEIRAYDQRFRSVLQRRDRTALPDLVVVEFKAGLDEASRLQRLVESLPVQLDRCSKYMMASRPSLAYNLSAGPP